MTERDSTAGVLDRLAAAYPDPVADPSPEAWRQLVADLGFETKPLDLDRLLTKMAALLGRGVDRG